MEGREKGIVIVLLLGMLYGMLGVSGNPEKGKENKGRSNFKFYDGVTCFNGDRDECDECDVEETCVIHGQGGRE